MTALEARSDLPRLTTDGHTARIQLRRPERHNAIEASDVTELRAHFDAVDGDDAVRVLIVTGSGESTFCSGASLPQIESGEMSGEIFQTLTARLQAVRVPTICAINGDVFGGGVEIALSCDFRIGVLGSRLGVPAARLGICYPLEGLQRFVSSLGLPTTRRILVAGEELDAEEMVRVGFLDRLVSPEELEDVTDEMAGRLSALAPLAVRSMKRLVLDVSDGTVDEPRARAMIAECAESDDRREGLRAWREQRPARFMGR